MNDAGALLRDNDSLAGRLTTSVLIIAVALVATWLVRWIVARRAADTTNRYYVRKAIGYAFVILALIALAVVWRPFAGRLGVVLGFMAAGVAFAMQEVIGAIAGWFNILSGRIYRVGDRVELGGVKGDVIDITPLRTKILEMGSSSELDPAWVRGRQHTGRIVAISNKVTFTDPVFNYSTDFDYIWEELTLPIPHDADWRAAEIIMLDEARATSGAPEAAAALHKMAGRYPVPITELEPRVCVRATDSWMELAARHGWSLRLVMDGACGSSWMELAARFVVPVRTARSSKDDLTRRIVDRLVTKGIPLASQTMDVSIRVKPDTVE